MTMLFDKPEYGNYRLEFAAGNLNPALAHLAACLADTSLSADDRAFAMQLSGKLAAELGQLSEAKSWFEQSKLVATDSILTRLGWAKFVNDQLLDHQQSQAECTAILAACDVISDDPTEQESRLGFYIVEAKRIERAALAKRPSWEF
jgi:hypothetical protein